ncbi:MAG: putative Coenzyme F420-dependent N(10)-methylenetetrahydromethanopterin reductase [Acidimicrobiia bacterium]|nr:putative Coenzyme F420-dependent N(10)-methylenetetrahydromethanopterin reductase [Acidimicrobiia bacterium]
MTDLKGVERLGCYVLPGGVTDPRKGIDQAKEAEKIGLGTVWIGERYDTKDLPSLAGAISQVTTRVRIAAGITHQGLRHPMVLASMGQTLQSLSNERFVLGLGRSAAWRWEKYGAVPPTLASMGDTADILRRLWAGETVSYNGPAGNFPELRLPQRPDAAPPPIVLAAIGPKGLQLAGSRFDGVILHPFLTPEAVGKSVEVVRRAATEAGRDPEALRCYSTVVIAPEMSPRDQGLAVGSRAAGYLHVSGLGDAIAKANGWSADDLARYRSHPTLVALGNKQADKTLSREVLVELSETMPPSWLPSSSASGSLDACVSRLNEYLSAGADEIVLHGATAETLGGLAERFGHGGPWT